MHIVYLGSVSSKEEAAELSGASVAGNNMQWNVLTELSEYEDVSIDAFTLLSVASFPKERRLFIRKKRKKIAEGIWVTQVSFINIPFIKQWTQRLSLYRNAKRVVTSDSIIFSYNLYLQEGGALTKLKKKFGLKTVALLADLPIDDNYQRNGFGKLAYEHFFRMSYKNIAECENIIALNKQAIEEFAPNANYVIVEGGVEVGDCLETETRTNTEKNIVYTGALTEYSGICELLAAMKDINPQIVLDIYGDGPLRGHIQEWEKQYKRIRYRGKVPNDQMKKIQREAWLLVNPRPVGDRIARVTFPSKIFEYMISGRPVLSTKQVGFTEEYLEHMFIVEDNEPKTMAKKINQILLLEDKKLDEMGKKAQKFIICTKTWKQQVKRIYEFMKQIEKSEIVGRG